MAAATALYKLSALTTPGGTIPSLMSRELDMGLAEYVLKGDGRVSPTFYANMRQEPMFKASTVAIGSALTAMGLGFYAFNAAVELYIAKLVAGGGIGAGAVHAKIAGSKGVIVPVRLVAEHKKPAMLELQGHFLSADGSAAPFAYTTSVSLPALAAGNEAYTLGLCRVNASPLAAMRRFEIEFNYNVVFDESASELYPSFACYDAFAPRVRFTTADLGLISTIGVAGVSQSTAVGETPSRFFLQKLAPAGRVPAATAAHVKFGMTAGFVRPTSTSESDDGVTEQEYEVVNLDDGTNAILSVSTGAAMA